jgi:hypothetical protein
VIDEGTDDSPLIAEISATSSPTTRTGMKKSFSPAMSGRESNWPHALHICAESSNIDRA